MEFSYLDKDAYKDIRMMNEENMGHASFHICKYKTKNASRSLHRHKYIQINYVNKGSGYHIVNNNKIDVYKGDIFIIPPYVPHAILPHDDKSIEIFEFEFVVDFILPSQNNLEDVTSYMDFAYLEPFMVSEEFVRPRFKLSEELQMKIEDILHEALDEFTNKQPGYNLVIKSLLLKLLVTVGRAYTAEIKGTETEEIINKYKNVVSISLEYIKENYNKNLTLKEVAAYVNYSRSHFSYLFKVVTGQTLVEYINGLRVEKAIELLKTTTKSITEISFEVGFNTIPNFNKTFKQYTGHTPKFYR